eukprot:1161350-Pelagomonas_calceolata.AAC.15
MSGRRMSGQECPDLILLLFPPEKPSLWTAFPMMPKEVQCHLGGKSCHARPTSATRAAGEGESHFSGSGKEHQGPQAAMKTEMSSQEGGQHGNK